MSDPRPSLPPAYRFVLAIGTPIMSGWSRLSVTGLEHLPRTGPALLAVDHDSYWDPIAIAVAARKVRPIRALSKSTLWSNKFVGMLMDGMGHIPVERGISNAEAMQTAIEELRAGTCIGIFPEGTRSLGRLAEEVPEAVVVCCRTIGTVDVVRAPHRPRISVEFFLPEGGQLQPGESATAFSERILAEIRDGAPYEVPGRSRTEATFRTKLAAGEDPED